MFALPPDALKALNITALYDLRFLPDTFTQKM